MANCGDKRKPLVSDDAGDLTLGKEFAQMAGMALQLSTTRIVRILLTTIDAAFLGHLGTPQLAGVALSAMWQGVPSTFVQFCLQAITTLASQARGAGNNRLVGDWLQTAWLVALMGSIPVMLVFWNVHFLVGITMKDEATVEYAKQFSRMMMWSLLPQYFYVSLTSYFATIGVVMPATVCTCITVICNVVFNYVFIYGYGNFQGFGFIGSPLATVTSSYLQLLLFVFYTVVIKRYHRDYWRGWNREAISLPRVKMFLALGVPTGASSVVDWASGALAGSFSGLAGVQVAAGQNVLNGLFAMTYSTVSGFSTATQIRLARYLGEGKPQSAKRILAIGASTLVAGGMVICVILGVWHRKVWQIWSKDPDVVSRCDSALLAFMAGLLMAYVRFTLTVVSVSLGPKEANINLVANNIASWVIYIPLAYLMPMGYLGSFWAGLPGFWWSDFFGEAFKVSVLTWAVLRVDWEKASQEARAKAAVNQEDTQLCEKLEVEAYTSLGSYMSPAPNADTANVAQHSPGLLTRHAASDYEGLGKGDYHRSPGPMTSLDDI
eukprot:CAMPEP_0117518260 /NCGR_PEP_ID=MMETSP0784-20121206/32040_1 /TAXON_ID=39447 /ORGANISM="" /LENGTH=548 /DNA_ID=CAMNT_0005314175 /DNA_START=96 /DNA_END=1742 /DNA_ORIENTATION=-